MCFLVNLCLIYIASSICAGNLIEEDKDVTSPLKVAQCRVTCLEKFSVADRDDERSCMQETDCFMCWENCELLQSNFQLWEGMCHERDICFPGCRAACDFHFNSPAPSEEPPQLQPVLRAPTTASLVISRGVAKWEPVQSSTHVVYVAVARRSGRGPWRQLMQTPQHSARIPVGVDLRVLAVDKAGLVSVYAPERSSSDEERRGKRINTEIKSTSNANTPFSWELRDVSLIHQGSLVIGEIAWESREEGGVYLVTWEVDGGGLKGTLYTDATSVALSLWPDTIYHIQVELISHHRGNPKRLKSTTLTLDTSMAQKITSNHSGIHPQTLTSSLDRRRRDALTTLAACFVFTFLLLLAIVILTVIYWRRRRCVEDGTIIGASTVNRRKLKEECDIEECKTDICPQEKPTLFTSSKYVETV